MDLTWAGWVFVIMVSLGILVNLGYFIAGREERNSPEVCFISAFFGVVWLVVFFSVGFVK